MILLLDFEFFIGVSAVQIRPCPLGNSLADKLLWLSAFFMSDENWGACQMCAKS